MVEAVLWGGFAAGSLLLGAVIACTLAPGDRLLGLIMGFGAGTLLSAVSFEMIGKSIEQGQTEGIAGGLLVGSLVYAAADAGVSGLGGRHRKIAGKADEGGSETGIIIGIVLDGIPESFVVGITLAGDGSASPAFITAVFISNLPEAITCTAGLRKRWSAGTIYAGWSAMVLLCGLMAGLGYVTVQNNPGWSGARIEAFAAGAVLTMLATTMMPEALRHAGRAAGVVTVLGYILALTLTLAG